MPVTRTARRALRKSQYKQARNKIVRAKIKNVVKEVKKAVDGKKEVDNQTLIKKLAKTLDKAAKDNVIHKNKAARLKSRLTQKLNLVKGKTTVKKAPKGKTKKKS